MVLHDMNMFIDGEWVGGSSSRDILDPSTGDHLASAAYGDISLADAACESASSAFAAWKGTSARKRSELLANVADLLDAEAERIGRILSMESGKRLQEAVGEVRFSVEYFRWFSERARDPLGLVLSSEVGGRRSVTTEVPAGVAAILTPWNFPVSIQARKVAAALAAGCTVVSRASEKAPLAVGELFEVLRRAGIPQGVVNLVQGPAQEFSERILQHEAVQVVSFTGSTAVGRSIMEVAANRVLRPALELGGDAPFIVFDDANIDAAVDGAMIAKFRNNGQSCIGANRFYVHEKVYEEFLEKLSRRVSNMRIGVAYGAEEVDLGPVIDRKRAEAVEALVDEAVRLGAERLTDDIEVPEYGTFCSPVLLTNVPGEARLASEEVFGPAAGIFSFSYFDELLNAANNTEMGLAAYAYTNQSTRIARFISEVEAGVIGINTPVPSTPSAPMGGLKQSGLGREGGYAGMHEFLETKYAAIE